MGQGAESLGYARLHGRRAEEVQGQLCRRPEQLLDVAAAFGDHWVGQLLVYAGCGIAELHKSGRLGKNQKL